MVFSFLRTVTVPLSRAGKKKLQPYHPRVEALEDRRVPTLLPTLAWASASPLLDAPTWQGDSVLGSFAPDDASTQVFEHLLVAAGDVMAGMLDGNNQAFVTGQTQLHLGDFLLGDFLSEDFFPLDFAKDVFGNDVMGLDASLEMITVAGDFSITFTVNFALGSPLGVPTMDLLQFPNVTLDVSQNGSVTIAGVTVTSPGAEELDLVLNVQHGTLEITQDHDEAVVQNNGTGQVSLYGTPRGLNAVLPSLVYRPSQAFTGLDTLEGQLSYWLPNGVAGSEKKTLATSVGNMNTVVVLTAPAVTLDATSVPSAQVLPVPCGVASVPTAMDALRATSNFVKPDAGGAGGNVPGLTSPDAETAQAGEENPEAAPARGQFNFNWLFRLMNWTRPAQDQPMPPADGQDNPSQSRREEFPDDSFSVFPAAETALEPTMPFALTDRDSQADEAPILRTPSARLCCADSEAWLDSFRGATAVLLATSLHDGARKARKSRVRLRSR